MNHPFNIAVTKEKKDIMKSLFHKVMEYKTNAEENNDNKDFIIPELGYYICLGGDIDYSNYTEYNINDNKVEQEQEYKYHESSDSEDSQYINEGDMDSSVTPDESSDFSD